MDNMDLINKAIKYIQKNFLDGGIRLENIAASAGFSIYYFDKLFIESTGMTAMEYVRRMRLNRAAVLLKKSNDLIMDIALECGYETGESFAKAFKKVYAKTPSEYRSDITQKITWQTGATGTPDIRLNASGLPLRQLPLDYAIAFIKNKNLYENIGNAETFLMTPTTAYTFSHDEQPDDFVCLSEYTPEEFAFFVIADDAQIYAEYIRKLCHLPGAYFELMYDGDICDITKRIEGVRFEIKHYLYYAYLNSEPMGCIIPPDLEISVLGGLHILIARKYSEIYQSDFPELHGNRLGGVLKLQCEKGIPDDEFIGIIKDGALISWARLSSVEGSDFIDFAYIETILPMRRKGYGNTLLRFCVNRILENGKIPYYSNISSNNFASINTCIKAGFSPVGKRWYLRSNK